MIRASRMALLGVAVLLAGCSSGAASSDSLLAATVPVGSLPAGSSTGDTTGASAVTSTAAPGETTIPAPVPVYPLTGLPVTDAATASRPALVVKIDNNKAARPQSGLNEADIVFEEIVEVQTRFAAVFQSQGAEPVGPIRSGRTQDLLLLGSFDRPLFMWSGGNKNVTNAIENSDFVNLSAQRSAVYGAAGFFRNSNRSSPHDLYASTAGAWALAPDGASPPPQQFTYRAAGQAAEGEPAIGTDGEMDGLAVAWRFDSASNTYLRSSGGVAHNDALSGQVNSHNIVVMFVDYLPSAADARSPEAGTIGTGELMVFTGGMLTRGTWTRADRLSPIRLLDSAGSDIALTPGRTFIELARVGTYVPVS